MKLVATSLLLCVALVSTIFAARGTVQAYQRFQQDHKRIMAGDVTTVSSWMTIPYIARIYHVPAGCLDGALHVSNPVQERHASLGYLASIDKEPVDNLIRTVENVITSYREKHPICVPPVSPPASQPKHYPMPEQRELSSPGQIAGGTF
jgi:hypothetical protein